MEGEERMVLLAEGTEFTKLWSPESTCAYGANVKQFNAAQG